MAARIEVTSLVEDTRAKVKKAHLENIGFSGKIKAISLVDVFTIDKSFSSLQLKKIAEMLINPVSQDFNISTEKKKNPMTPKKFDWAVEVGFLPGVTDNIGHTVKEEIEDFFKKKFKKGEDVYSSQIIFINGKLEKKDLGTIVKNLINSLIQRVEIKSFEQFKLDLGMDFIVPKVKLTGGLKVSEVNLEVDDNDLEKTGKLGIENQDGIRRGPLALNLPYMKAIQNHFRALKRNPTDIELETLAQTWSEHCKHTIFADPLDEIKKGLFKTYIKGATEKINHPFCISVFSDNSGAIEFDKEFLITHKVETHNSPSALDPFGGAITGIVGVNRDTIGFGLGAKPVLNTYGFCFAPPDEDSKYFRDLKLTQEVLPSRRIMEGVIEGVNAGGNQSGIPTPQGFLFFDERFRAKPLVFCGTVGLLPKKVGNKLSHLKKAQGGDYIVMIGGRVGLDGIHGATFSSEAITSGSPATAVQIGDPITQKKFSDAVVKEARDLNLFNSITDNGGGGLSSSVGEMAKESNGCRVQLDKVPLKYPGLAPWQIWISESQERMTLAVPKNRWKRFLEVMKKHGVEATIMGEFTNSGKCQVLFKNKLILDLSLEFLHNGLPKIHRKTRKPKSGGNASTTLSKYSVLSKRSASKDSNKLLFYMLSRLNIASFEFISQQYDHEVLGESVIKPLQGKGRVNGDATISRVVLNSQKGVVLSQGYYPSYSELDSYEQSSNSSSYNTAASSIDTAVRNAVCVGVNLEKIALLDNFCWPSGDDPERLYQLKEAARACYDYSTAYKTPFISGKDSMFNDFMGFDNKGNPVKISVPPTLLISSIGIIDDITKAVSLDFKFPGDLIYILGETSDELGGSEYMMMQADYNVIPAKAGIYTNNIYRSLIKSGMTSESGVPKVDATKNLTLYKSLQKAIEKELVVSAQSITRGGLAVGLAKSALGGMLGVEVDLKNLPGNPKSDEVARFSESQGRIIVSVNPKNKKKFEKLFKDIKFGLIGKVRSDNRFIIKNFNEQSIVDMDLKLMQTKYKGTFNGF